MKIATFNINNINKRLPNLLAWLRSARPDVVCLQELKSTDADFPITAMRRAGYDAVWRGQKSWNGVAILARGMEPVLTRSELPGDPDERIYTFWDYMRNRWPRDAGLRIDHILLSRDLAERLKASGVDRAVRGKPNASDHAPVWVELSGARTTRKSPSPKPAKTAAR